MAQYYDTTPWLIPKADDRLAALFRQHGSFFSVKKGSMLDAINIKGDGHNVTFLQAGLLGQCYDTGEPGRPHAISIVLPGRIINYFDYLGIDHQAEKFMVLRNSDVWICRLDTLKAALKEEGLEELYHRYCMDCIASDYGAFMLMFSTQTEERLGHFLLSLAESLGCRPKGDVLFVPLKLTYTELSYVMHSTVKTIERILAKWHQADALSSNRDGFTLSLRFFKDVTADHYMWRD